MDFGDCGTRHVIANVCWEVVSLFCKRRRDSMRCANLGIRLENGHGLWKMGVTEIERNRSKYVLSYHITRA